MKHSTLLLLLCSCSLMAQDFNSELLGKMLPAKIKFVDRVERDVLIKYQTFEYYKFPQNRLRISMSKSEDDAYDHTGGIESFMVGGNIWALRPVPGSNKNQFVILKVQGAIESYEYVKYGEPGDKEDQNIVVIGSRTGSITRKVGTKESIEGVVPDEKIRQWIADSPEVMEDLKKAEAEAQANKAKQDSIAAAGGAKPKEQKFKGLMGKLEQVNNKQEEIKEKESAKVDMNRIINNYNAWYEQRNQGQIQYQFVSAATWLDIPKKTKTADERKTESDASLNKLFANRTTTVSAEMASAKDNVPVKKETFAGKMGRIKADGNKVGVVLLLQPVHVPKPTTNTSYSFSQPVDVEGEYMDETLKAVGPELVQELNQALGTNDIELIDITKIPYREVKVLGVKGRIDDWWATKYKLVFAYTVDPRLETTHESMDSKVKFNATLQMINPLIVTEYIGDPTSTKQDIITQLQNVGNFRSQTLSQADDITDVKAIYTKILEKLGSPILERMKAERGDNVKKLVEKKLTP